MHPALLKELVVAYGVGVAAVLLLHRVRVPAIVGFLVAGVLLGPHGLRLVEDVDSVAQIAEIGVVILLFTIGVEMSLARVVRMGVGLLLAGLLQMGLATAGAAFPVAMAGGGPGRALTLGLLVAVSSTTLLLRTLGERGEIEAPHGRLALGISLVQDLALVPIMVLLPLVAGGGEGAAGTGLVLGKAALVIGGTALLARLVVPRAMEAIVNTRSRELFVLTVIFLCLGTAYLAGLAGLSLALGAFLGGLVVSESPYSQQVLGEMLPLRDGLAGLFFVGVGMFLDVGHVAANAPHVLGIVAAIVLFKTVTTGLAVLAAGYGARVAVLAGIALAQVGEFSFVLSREARRLALLDADTEQLFVAAAVLSMAASPFLYRLAPALADAAGRLSRGRVRRRVEAESRPPEHGDHVIVAGYGLAGQNVAAALAHNGRPFVVLEMNPETVRRERAKGVPILYGDAGYPEVLEHAGVREARALVVAIGDPAGTQRVVAVAKSVRPGLHVIARARYVREAEDLVALGADEVVPDELEASIELFARVLRAYGHSSEVIEQSVATTRATRAVRSRAAAGGLAASGARTLAGVDLETHVVGPGAPADGKSIGELDVHRVHGVTIVGVTRAGYALPDPAATTRLEAADVVVLVGKPERLAASAALFRPPPAAKEPEETPRGEPTP